MKKNNWYVHLIYEQDYLPWELLTILTIILRPPLLWGPFMEVELAFFSFPLHQTVELPEIQLLLIQVSHVSMPFLMTIQLYLLSLVTQVSLVCQSIPCQSIPFPMKFTMFWKLKKQLKKDGFSLVLN